MPPARHLRAVGASLLVLLLAAPAAFATAPATGKLRIIHLDVGQGDGAVLITPGGQVAMFDNGPGGTGAMGQTALQQLQALGVTSIEHHFASHYHSDHIGATLAIVNGGIPIANGWDRAGTYGTSYYTNYVTALGSHRKTILKNQVITLDSLSAHPVRIKCVDLAGAGISTTDENSLSMVVKVSYGEFDMTFGGDLPGQNSGSYKNIETTVGPEAGPVEAYKVHHHGSATSSLNDWLAATTPKVAVISCGNGNSYGHPTASAVNRLHSANVKTYWTETGTGATPLAGWDYVSNGQIAITATWEGAGVDTIRGNGFTHTFTNSGTAPDMVAPLAALLSPSGGEVWKAGSAHTITWSASDNVAVTSVDLAWSADGGGSWSAIATGIANTGSYPWTAPTSGTGMGRVRVRARDAAGNLGADSSLTNVTVDFWTVTASAGAGGSITPSGVVDVVEGASAGFTIAPTAGFQVQDLLVDGGSQGVQTSWTFTGVAAHHTLAASFLDVAPPTIALLSPVGGEHLSPGATSAITWSAADNLGVDSVDVDVSYTGVAGPWLALAHGLSNSGSWSWAVPSVSTDSARVRVTAYDAVRNSRAAMSDSAFTIGTSSADVAFAGPARLYLAPPSPNPAVGPMALRFSLAAEGEARLEVLDVSGRRVAQHAGTFAAGPHAWVWDGRETGGGRLGAGVYLARLHTAQGTRTQRIILLR